MSRWLTNGNENSTFTRITDNGHGTRYFRVKDKSDSMKIQVECYSGYRGEETPRHFIIGERIIEISKVLDRWLAPDHRYFKVRGADGALYILRHDMTSLNWELILFDLKG